MAVPGKKVSQKFSSTLSHADAEGFKNVCEQCHRDDIRLPAFGYCVDCEEHICQTCFNTHKRPKALRHHQLLDKDEMPQKQNLKKSLKSNFGGKTSDLSKPCTKHTNEVIKFYCKDHNSFICSVCVTLDHTTASCQVDYIPDISRHILDSTAFKETLTDIDKLTDECCQITNDLKQRVAESTTSLRDSLAEIENFRKEINKILDELEKKVKDTVTTIQHDNHKKLKTAETVCNDINKSFQESTNSLKHLNRNKKADLLFTELKITQQLLQNNKKRISQLPTVYGVYEYIFEPNQAIKKLLQNEKSLGTLSKMKIKQFAQPKTQVAAGMKMSIPRNTNVKSFFDEKDCCISGTAVVPENQLFAVDFNNYAIKMIDINSGSIKQLQLVTEPRDVTKVNKDTIAVTLPNSETIQMIFFSSNSLSLKNKLKVDAKCYGISHHQGKLAVTFINPAKLQIMDLKGNTEITVDKDSNGDNIFSKPFYISTNSHSIYVSDCDKEAILWLNWYGEVIGRHVGIMEPSGITLIDDWSFLVTDRSSHCIYRVSGDCKDSGSILKDVNYPEAICWCAETSTLCISRYHSVDKIERNNQIKLYKMM